MGKENHGPIKLPLKGRKTAKDAADVALTARVTTQAAALASGHVPDPVLTASISEARQVAQSLEARYLLPMPQSVIFQPSAYPASPSAPLAATSASVSAPIRHVIKPLPRRPLSALPVHEPPVLSTPSVPNTQNPHLFDAALYERAAVEYTRIEEEYKRTCKLPSVPPPATSTTSADADPGDNKAPCIPPPPSERLLDDPTVWLLNSRSLQSKPARYCAQTEWAATYCSAEFPIPAEQPCPSSDA
ncbi:hypothetical protein EV121DRAFT_297425 [Schizophyllum commune]